MIPSILHRTLPAQPRTDVDRLWQSVLANTAGWEHRTYQSPRDAADWPITGELFKLCHDRAMESNLVRLEALWTHGGFYLDSDVELVRPLEPLLIESCVVGWEDRDWIGTAVIGAEPKHPAIAAALEIMSEHVRSGRARSSMPRLVTGEWKDRTDVTRLQEAAFYPYHPAHNPHQAHFDWSSYATVYAVHRWHKSW